MKERKISTLLLVLFFCFTNVVFGQHQTKIDTILCHNRNMIIKYPSMSKISNVNYEEGCLKIINCVLDTAMITIQCGSMVNLPLTDLSDKIICSEFLLDKEVRIIRGYHITNKRKKYFREENYLKYGISVVYENVEETRLIYYEHIFNEIKIQ